MKQATLNALNVEITSPHISNMPEKGDPLYVDWCSYKAAKFACKNWHYSKCMPAVKPVELGVWEHGDFIGSIVFSRSPSPNIGSTYNLEQHQIAELSRVALDDHEHPVSQIVTIGMKLLHSKDDGLELLISYADPKQEHHGGIYQAMNWIYTGQTSPSREAVLDNGQTVHSRSVSRAISKGWLKRESISHYNKLPGKHKYIFPLNDEIERKVQALSKPYP